MNAFKEISDEFAREEKEKNHRNCPKIKIVKDKKKLLIERCQNTKKFLLMNTVNRRKQAISTDFFQAHIASLKAKYFISKMA